MERSVFPGVYSDDRGSEDVRWSIEPSTRRGWSGRFEVRAVIRGIEVWGADLDGLEPTSLDEARAVLPLSQADELSRCVLSGELPCIVTAGEVVAASTIRFVLDLRHQERPENRLTLSCVVDGTEFAVTDSSFEDGVQRLEKQLPDGVEVRACVTCLFSDYSPGGHGLMGIRCHRGAKSQYLAVRSKVDYWPVPVTEEVPETHLCPEYERRIPGTGYRG